MYSMRPFIRTVLLLLDLWRQHVVLVDGPSPGICQPTTYDGPLPETATLGVGTDGSGQMEGHSVDLGIYLAIELSPLSSGCQGQRCPYLAGIFSNCGFLVWWLESAGFDCSNQQPCVEQGCRVLDPAI